MRTKSLDGVVITVVSSIVFTVVLSAVLCALVYYSVFFPRKPVTVSIGELNDNDAERQALQALSKALRRHPKARRVKVKFRLSSARHSSETSYISYSRVADGLWFKAGERFQKRSYLIPGLHNKTSWIEEKDLHYWAWTHGEIRAYNAPNYWSDFEDD